VQRYGKALGLTPQALKIVLQPYGLENEVVRIWFKKPKRETEDPFDLDDDW
jgi:hypothetical protein